MPSKGYSMGAGSGQTGSTIFKPQAGVDYTRIPVNNGPSYSDADGFFPFGEGAYRAMTGNSTEFPSHGMNPGQGNPNSHFLGKGAGGGGGMPNFGGSPNSGGSAGGSGSHLTQAGTKFSKGADKFDSAVNRLVNALGGSGGVAGVGGVGGQGGAGMGAGAPRNAGFGGGDPVGMLQQANLINGPSAPGSLGFGGSGGGYASSPFQLAGMGRGFGARGAGGFNPLRSFQSGAASNPFASFRAGAAQVFTDASAQLDGDFDPVLGNDPFTQMYNYSGGLTNFTADMMAGIPGLNLAAGPSRALGNIVSGIRGIIPGVPSSNEVAKTMGLMGHMASMGAASDVTQYMQMVPHTGTVNAAQARSVLQSGGSAAAFEFDAFRTMGMMGMNHSVFGSDPTSHDPLNPQNISGITKMLAPLTAMQKYLGLSPTSATGQIADALSAQGFKSFFIDANKGGSIGSGGASVVQDTQQRMNIYPSSGHSQMTGTPGNAVGLSAQELIMAQYAGFTPSQVGSAFAAQAGSSNLGLIGAFGGRSILQQANFFGLTGSGADRYINAVRGMGSGYTQLGYEFGRGQTEQVGSYTFTDHEGTKFTNPTGFAAKRIESEIATLQESGFSNFAQENAFGAFQRIDMRMGKGTSRFGASLFAGIKDKVIFSQLVGKHGLRGGMEKAGTLTPGQERKMLDNLLGRDVGYMLTRGAGLTHEEADATGQMANPADLSLQQRGLPRIDEDGNIGQGQFKARSAVSKQNLQRMTDFYFGNTTETDADGNPKKVFQAFQVLTETNTEIKAHLDRGVKVEGVPEMVRGIQNLSRHMEHFLKHMTNKNLGPVNQMKVGAQTGPNAANPTGTTAPVSGTPSMVPSPF